MTPAKKRKLKRQTCRIAGQLNIPNDVLFGPVFYDKTGELYKTYLSNSKFLRGQTRQFMGIDWVVK